MHTSKFNHLFLSGVLLTITGFNVLAQDRPPYWPFTARVEVGTTGPGGALAWRFLDNLGVRAGANYFEYSDTGTIKDVDYHARLRLLSEPLTLDIFPWQRSSFHISVGILLNQNRLTGNSTATGNQVITLDDVSFPASNVGTLHLRARQKPIDPYLSIGGNFFYFDHAHHWSMGGELGVAYTGDPRVSLSRSGGVADPAIDAAVLTEEAKIRHEIRDYRFWPILKLAVNFAF